MGHPSPIRSRLAPVMLASASARRAGTVAALHARFMSTAYSGSTVTRARNTTARPAPISISATSAAHVRMKAAETIATP